MGGTVSLPMRMNRKVLPQMTVQTMNASVVRDGAGGGRDSGMRAVRPFGRGPVARATDAARSLTAPASPAQDDVSFGREAARRARLRAPVTVDGGGPVG